MFTLKNHSLLVIAPHPDDEVIGCGGIINKIKGKGGKVYVLFLTVGDTKDFSENGISSIKDRLKEIKKVAKFLNYDEYHIAFPANDFHLKLDTLGQKRLMDLIERESSIAIEKIKPTILAYPSLTSYNQDHNIAAHASHAAVRPATMRDKYFVPYVLSYEEPADGWTMIKDQQPNFYISLSEDQIKAKIEAMKLYESQIRAFPNPRSLETLKILATFRGSQNSTDFAESFISYRSTI